MRLLNEATFAEITEELSRRYDNIVVVVHRRVEEDTNPDHYRHWYSGNANVMMGLLVTVTNAIDRTKEGVTIDEDDAI